MGKNWPTLVMLGIAGVVYGVMGIPWANMYGAWWITVVFYGVLLLAAVYCKCNREPIHTKMFHRKARRTPQDL